MDGQWCHSYEIDIVWLGMTRKPVLWWCWLVGVKKNSRKDLCRQFSVLLVQVF